MNSYDCHAASLIVYRHWARPLVPKCYCLEIILNNCIKTPVDKEQHFGLSTVGISCRYLPDGSARYKDSCPIDSGTLI